MPPVPMSREQLLETLAGISNAVRSGDSLAATVSFDVYEGGPCPVCGGVGCGTCAGTGDARPLPAGTDYWVQVAHRTTEEGR